MPISNANATLNLDNDLNVNYGINSIRFSLVRESSTEWHLVDLTNNVDVLNGSHPKGMWPSKRVAFNYSVDYATNFH